MPAERREVSRQWNSLTFYHFKISFHAHALVAGPSCQHFIEDDSKCPDIALLRVVIFFICLWRHVFRRANVIKNLRSVGHFLHLAIPEIDDCYLFAAFGISFEQYVIRFQIPMDDLLAPHVDVSFEDLPENEESLNFRQSSWMFFEVIRESASFKMFHHEIDKVILECNIVQLDNILMPSVCEFAEVAEGGYFAAEEILGDLIVNGS